MFFTQKIATENNKIPKIIKNDFNLFFLLKFSSTQDSKSSKDLFSARFSRFNLTQINAVKIPEKIENARSGPKNKVVPCPR